METILYLPCFDYFRHRQRPQHLLWELSRVGFRVVYCQPPGTGPISNGRPGVLVPLSDTFMLCQDIEALDYGETYIMWLTHGPYARSLPELLNRGLKLRLVVSDFADACVEEFQEFAQYDPDKISCADIAIAASHAIHDNIRQLHPNAHLVPNAADVRLFSMAIDPSHDLPCPLEVATILGSGEPGTSGPLSQDAAAQKFREKPKRRDGRKLIGFWGAITTWVDLDLMIRVAVRRPMWHFLFIGSIGVAPGLLPRLSNITFIGDRDYLSLPFYARWFDAAIIPFEVRGVTRSAQPIKAYEYLAAGLPVVSTDLPEIRGLGDIRIVEGNGRELVDSFISALEWATSDGWDPKAVEARLEAVSKETWTERARQIAELIQGYSVPSRQ